MIVEPFSALFDDFFEESAEWKEAGDPYGDPKDKEDSHLNEEVFVTIIAWVFSCEVSLLKLKLAEQLLVRNEDKSIEAVAEDSSKEDEPLEICNELSDESLFTRHRIEVIQVENCDCDCRVDDGVAAQKAFAHSVMSKEIGVVDDKLTQWIEDDKAIPKVEHSLVLNTTVSCVQ